MVKKIETIETRPMLLIRKGKYKKEKPLQNIIMHENGPKKKEA
jgi:hypothetical protein